MSGRIRLMVSDLDGTLVLPDKTLAPSTIAAARRLADAGIPLALVSARPPRGMRWVSDTLGLATPLAGFNGGTIVGADGQILSQKTVPAAAAREAIAMFDAEGIDTWLFTADEWLVRSEAGHYVPRERITVRFNERVVDSFDAFLGDAGKIVGSTEDFEKLATIEATLAARLGDTAAVRRSQHYYLDVTHREADKGHAVTAFSRLLGIPLDAIGVIGDMANDVPMFEVAGLSIAMGNATDAVKAKATSVTSSNAEDGFAHAVDRFVLGTAT